MRTKNIEELKDIDSGLLAIIERVEKRTGFDFYFNSIKRSTQENKDVGGYVKSQHLDLDLDGDSQAVDIARWSFEGSPEYVAQLFYEEGATGVGIYNGHIHVDNNPLRIDNPYFKDYRTVFTSFDKFKEVLSYNYFGKFYNKSLAILRKGKKDIPEVVEVPGTVPGTVTDISDDKLKAIGLAFVSILVLVGLLGDKKS